jgi:hypothetical protein
LAQRSHIAGTGRRFEGSRKWTRMEVNGHFCETKPILPVIFRFSLTDSRHLFTSFTQCGGASLASYFHGRTPKQAKAWRDAFKLLIYMGMEE